MTAHRQLFISELLINKMQEYENYEMPDERPTEQEMDEQIKVLQQMEAQIIYELRALLRVQGAIK